jgi:hypothetical protein
MRNTCLKVARLSLERLRTEHVHPGHLPPGAHLASRDKTLHSGAAAQIRYRLTRMQFCIQYRAAAAIAAKTVLRRDVLQNVPFVTYRIEDVRLGVSHGLSVKVLYHRAAVLLGKSQQTVGVEQSHAPVAAAGLQDITHLQAQRRRK